MCVDTSSSVFSLLLYSFSACTLSLNDIKVKQGAVKVDSVTDRPCLVNMFNINDLQSEPFGGACVISTLQIIIFWCFVDLLCHC